MGAALQISHQVILETKQLPDEDVNAGAGIVRCGAVTLATGLLVVLSWLNAFHSPAFDCIRAGASAMRLRRAVCAAALRAEEPPAVYQHSNNPSHRSNEARIRRTNP